MEREDLLQCLQNVLDGAYGDVLNNIAMWQCVTALGVKPVKDGNLWSILYENNTEDGVCAYGSTIYEAVYNFYNKIQK